MNNEQIVAEIKEAVRVGKGARVLREIVNKYDGACYWCIMVGQSVGSVEGIPLKLGTYDTVNWGELQTFSPSSATIGSTVSRNNKQLTVIANTGTMGDASMPSNYWFVAVEQ